MQDNNIVVIGNLTDDPELRFTPQGVAVANCRVAVNARVRNSQTNEWEDRLDGYFTVNIWRDHAENVAESLGRGARVVVMGRLKSRSYEDKEGQTRWVTEIEADEIAPSLKWARASISKQPSGGGQSRRGGNGWGGSNGAPAPAEAPVPDDVPF